MSCALIVIDMVNTYEHEDADPLMASVADALPSMRELIARARDSDLMTLYVNDNYGDWSADRDRLVERALASRGAELATAVLPPEEIAFVVKARHSIFYETLLEYLLRQERVDRIILSGQVTEQCILYSALDAYVRHFEVVVPRPAVAHIHEDLADAALRMMEMNMRAQIAASASEALEAAIG
jgi:nicotinamidase-related amidase